MTDRDVKYLTKKESAEILGTSQQTIVNYTNALKEELTDEEYNKAFNNRNQASEDLGLKYLKDMMLEKNPNFKFIEEINELKEKLSLMESEHQDELDDVSFKYEKTIKDLEEDNKKLRENKEEMNEKFMDLYKDTNNKLTELIHQSNTIAASLALANQKIEELESKTIETKTYESSYEEPEEKKSFFQKLFGK